LFSFSFDMRESSSAAVVGSGCGWLHAPLNLTET
jgi:hypothetical protein